MAIFNASGYTEYNLAPASQVAERQKYDMLVRAKQIDLGEFMEESTVDVAQMLAGQTAHYMMAGRRILQSKTKLDTASVAAEEKLDTETLQRWVEYLGMKVRQHPYLREWDALMARGGTDVEAQGLADQFQKLVLEIIGEKKKRMWPTPR